MRTLRKTLNEIFNSYKIDSYGQISEERVREKALWVAEENILQHFTKERPYCDARTDQEIPLGPPVNNLNVTIENFVLGGEGHQFTKNITQNVFNFQNSNLDLQNHLNDLSGLLAEGGKKEEAKELENTAKALEQAEQCQSKEEVKKKGIGSRLKRLVGELGDEKSELSKSVKGIKHGVSVAQDIGKVYNSIAQWIGWPQVPEPFLKKPDKEKKKKG